MSVLDDEPVEIPCPKCGAKHQKTIGWLNVNDRFACSCGVTITLDNRSGANLERSMMSLGVSPRMSSSSFDSRSVTCNFQFLGFK